MPVCQVFNLTTKKTLWVFLVFLVIGIRTFQRFLLPEIWAEDGAVFLADAYNVGFNGIFNVYSGYTHILPRLISYLAVLFPVSVIPSFLFLVCYIITGLILSYFLRSEFSYLVPSVSKRGIFCVLLAVSLPFSEVFGNICNLQWFVNIFLFLFLISDKNYTYKIWQIVIFCSGILSTGALPIFVLLFFIRFISFLFSKENKWFSKDNILFLIILTMVSILFCYNILQKGGDRIHSLISIKRLCLTVWYYIYSMICFPVLGNPNTGIFSMNLIKEFVFRLAEMSVPASCFCLLAYKVTKKKCLNWAILSVIPISIFYTGLLVLTDNIILETLTTRYSVFLAFSSIFLWFHILNNALSSRQFTLVLFFMFELILSTSILEYGFFIEPYGYERLWEKHQNSFSKYLKTRNNGGYVMPIYPIWDPPVWYLILK